MLEFLETLGFIAILIIVALVILVIALIKAIFDIQKNTEQTTIELEEIKEYLKVIAQNSYRN